ncbi:MAG: hypothetical protein ACR2JD_01850 [Nocardioides sp.]
MSNPRRASSTDRSPAVRGGRRAAARRPSRWSLEAVGRGRLPVVGFLLMVAAGLGALVVEAFGSAPGIVATAGAVLVSTAYAWAVAARTGGRPVVFGLLALAIGGTVLVTGGETVRSGAAVLTCAASAVLAVLITVPAVKVVQALREVLVAFAVAAVGAAAAIGFRPLIALVRFEYTTLALSLVIVLALVYRLGAGFHGLGRRGLVVLLGGGAVLALGLAYAELLRLYGTPALVAWLFDAAHWSVEHLGAAPRPMQALLGIPMLAWGVHMRARRRQGWWACVFGVVGMVPISHVLADPGMPLLQAVLTEVYSLVAGLAVGVLLIQADRLLSGSGGRRASRAEEEGAVRPEAGRVRPLL